MAAWLKCGLGLGAGIIVGGAAIYLLSRNSKTFRKGLVSAASHGLDLKERARAAVSSAKADLEEFAAEVRTESNKRSAAKA